MNGNDSEKFKKVMDRISHILETDMKMEPYDKQIANALGLSSTQFANNKTRGKIPYPQIEEFCDKHEITMNWVLRGKSSMRLIDTEENKYKIRLIDKINASAGGGSYDDENIEYKYIYIDKTYAEKLGIQNTENFDAINVVGDSMEPTVRGDSIVLIDKTKNTLEGSGIYVVNTISGLFVKRLSLNPNGNIELISDNKNYPVMSMIASEVTIIGKVVGSLDKI